MMALYRAIAFCVWFGVAFVLCAIVLAVAAIAVIGAVAFGLLSPTRTPRSSLAALRLNAEAAIAHVRALKPQHP
jgi:hypothetical protein